MKRKYRIAPLKMIQGHVWVINRSLLEEEALNQECSSLEEPYFSTVLLHDYFEWSYGKIAIRLKRPVNTVKSQVCRGHRRLPSYPQQKEA